MMRSFFSGVSGMKAHQTRMDVIGNNIANVNTVGFKSSRTTFADTLSQTMTGASGPSGNRGGVNAKQVGLGVNVASIDTIFTDGSPATTGKNTDVALSGDALFVVKDGANTYYTRDGSFEFDEQGNYVLPGSGYYVQGWQTRNSDGTISSSGAPQNIVINRASSMPAAATTTATYTGNVSSDTAIGSSASSSLTVYDEQGNDYTIPVTFNKTAANTWSADLSATLYDKDGTTAIATVSPTSINVTFNTDGTLASPKSDSPAVITVTPDPTTRGTTAITVTANMDALTQFSGASSIIADTDGNATGTLANIAVNQSGELIGYYSNGESRAEAQIAVAQFTNISGLTKVTNSLYQESRNSGAAFVGAVDAFGARITPAALEMSNVDISNEFTDMIITQRGFQSNSKIVTVGDEMLETVINMKR